MLENIADSCIVQTMNPEVEEWRTIPDFPSYSVSDQGRVRRDTRGGGAQVGRILCQTRRRQGYLYVDLSESGVVTKQDVHRLVLLAFIGPPPTKSHQGSHGDGKPSNNTLLNLRWATVKENNADKLEHGTLLRGSKHPATKLSEEQIISIRREYGGKNTLLSMGRKYGCSGPTIRRIVTRKLWKHVS